MYIYILVCIYIERERDGCESTLAHAHRSNVARSPRPRCFFLFLACIAFSSHVVRVSTNYGSGCSGASARCSHRVLVGTDKLAGCSGDSARGRSSLLGCRCPKKIDC